MSIAEHLRFIAAVIILLVADATLGQAQAGSGEITFEKVVHDFGEVAPDSTHICEFKFKNTGNGVLKITNVTKSCACTPFALAKKEYSPGEDGTLKVRYHVGKRPGIATRHLYVFSNDKKNPRVELTIKANIVPKVSCQPRKLSLSLKKENAGCGQIILKSIDNKPFSIKKVQSIPECITIDFDPKVKATRFVLNPKVDIAKLREHLRGQISIQLTHPQCKVVNIGFEALPEFSANPSTLVVFKAEPEKPIKRELWILNNYGDKFEIQSTRSQKDIIKVVNTEEFGNRYRLDLEIIPPLPTGKSRLFKDVLFVKIKPTQTNPSESQSRIIKINCHGVYHKNVK